MLDIGCGGAGAFKPITLSWHDGLRATFIPFGARLCSLEVPTRSGFRNVVLGYGDLRAYRNDVAFMGCAIGRLTNRIAAARFTLGGKNFQLTRNDGNNQLHGGSGGLHAREWSILATDGAATRRLVLGLRSNDGEEGYPGNVDVQVTFTLEPQALNVTFEARSDRLTVFGMTLHPYFNLSGRARETIHRHDLMIDAGEFLPVHANLIPTGERVEVAQTPFDFRRPAELGARLASQHPQLLIPSGFDHTFVLQQAGAFAAELHEPVTRLRMRLLTNQPGLQLYSGSHLRAVQDEAWGPYCGLCLEPQTFPDAVNQRAFPAPLLRPGELYRNEIRYEFSED